MISVCYLLLSFTHSRLLFFFFNDTAPTEIYTLSLHDALPIYGRPTLGPGSDHQPSRPVVEERDLDAGAIVGLDQRAPIDRKSTRLNSSHVKISYAVFCLKKKKKKKDRKLLREKNIN